MTRTNRHHITVVRYGPITALLIALVMLPYYLLKLCIITLVLFCKALAFIFCKALAFIVIAVQKRRKSHAPDQHVTPQDGQQLYFF